MRGLRFGENGPFIGIGDPDFVFTVQGVEEGILTGLYAINSVWFHDNLGCYLKSPGFEVSQELAWARYAPLWLATTIYVFLQTGVLPNQGLEGTPSFGILSGSASTGGNPAISIDDAIEQAINHA